MVTKFDGYYNKELPYKMTFEEWVALDEWERSSSNNFSAMLREERDNLVFNINWRTRDTEEVWYKLNMAITDSAYNPAMRVEDENFKFPSKIHKDHWANDYKVSFIEINCDDYPYKPTVYVSDMAGICARDISKIKKIK